MITLLQGPPTYTFSGNFIPLKFRTDNRFEDSGQIAKNQMVWDFSVDLEIPESWTMQIRYGTTVLSFVAVSNPDTSGTQIPSGHLNSDLLQNIKTYLEYNAQLSNDFKLESTGIVISFESRKKGYGYNFEEFNDPFFYYSNREAGRPVIYRPNFAIQFDLYIQDKNAASYAKIYSNRLLIQPGDEDVASIDIADKLHNIIVNDGPDLPAAENGTYTCTKSCRSYYFTYAESYGDLIKSYGLTTSSKFTVLAGALSYLGAATTSLDKFLQPLPAEKTHNRFLKQGGNNIYTRPDQPQFLYWFNPDITGNHNLKVKFHFIDGSEAVTTKYTFSAGNFRKYAFKVGFNDVFNQSDYPGRSVERYELWLENALDFQVTEKLTYWLNYEHQQYARYFLYWSSFGSLDSMSCHGKGSSQFELIQQEAKKIRRSGYAVSDGDSRMFDIRLNSGFKAVTGWLTRNQLAINRDFYLAAYKYRYLKEQLLPIKITTGTIAEYPDGSNNVSQEFEYKYLFDDQAYTEGDVETNNLPVQDFIFGGFGRVRIVDQEGNLIDEVQAPGTFQVYRFDTIDGGNAFSTYELQIIKSPQ